MNRVLPQLLGAVALAFLANAGLSLLIAFYPAWNMLFRFLWPPL